MIAMNIAEIQAILIPYLSHEISYFFLYSQVEFSLAYDLSEQVFSGIECIHSICSIGSFISDKTFWILQLIIFLFYYIFSFLSHCFTLLKHILCVFDCPIRRFHPSITCIQCSLPSYDVRFNFLFHFFLNSTNFSFSFVVFSFIS